MFSYAIKTKLTVSYVLKKNCKVWITSCCRFMQKHYMKLHTKWQKILKQAAFSFILLFEIPASPFFGLKYRFEMKERKLTW